MGTQPRLQLTGQQILAQRRRAGTLDERLPFGPDSLRRAAWAGLQDSMPRSALLSIHARVEGTPPDAWADPAFVQVWGPRYNAYVIAARDLAVFTLGRMPDSPTTRRFAEDQADRIESVLDGRRLPYREVGRLLGKHARALAYAAPTGRVVIRWEGARQPLVWTVPRPTMEEHEAKRELARRYLHVLGPATADSFARWAGVQPPAARAALEGLAGELMAVQTPVGEGWILAADEPGFRAHPALPAAPARLLPSGDAYWLLWASERELLVPDAARRAELWTSRVWPGALLVGGQIVGTWRRDQGRVTIQRWRALSSAERDAVEAEAAALPLPGIPGPIVARWAD